MAEMGMNCAQHPLTCKAPSKPNLIGQRANHNIVQLGNFLQKVNFLVVISRNLKKILSRSAMTSNSLDVSLHPSGTAV